MVHLQVWHPFGPLGADFFFDHLGLLLHLLLHPGTKVSMERLHLCEQIQLYMLYQRMTGLPKRIFSYEGLEKPGFDYTLSMRS